MSLHYINDASNHHALLYDGGGSRILLCHRIPLYSSIITALGLDGAVPFLLQEHNIGHFSPEILSTDLLWVIWLQGVHHEQLAHFLLTSADSVLNEMLQALLHVILSHDDLCDQAELLVHAVLDK